MKTRILLISVLLLLNCNLVNGSEEKMQSANTLKGVINLNASSELYNLTLNWTDEYCNLNPLLKINVNKISESTATEVVVSSNEISFVSEELYARMRNHSVWSMVVGRDVIVPVMNNKSPFINEMRINGISLNALRMILQNPTSRTWGEILGGNENEPLQIYIANDQSVLSILNAISKSDWVTNDAWQLMGVTEMVKSIQNNHSAIGFCKLGQVLDTENKGLQTGLQLVPIDKNGNGKMDYMENIYDNIQSFTRGVWIGKYPKILSSDIYLVSPEKPQNEVDVAFLKWVLTDGQRLLGNNGYSELAFNERLTQLARLDEPEMYASVPVERTKTFLSALLLVLIVIVMGGVFVEVIFRLFAKGRKSGKSVHTEVIPVFTEETVIAPKGLYFDRSHSWAFMRKNGSVKVGIDDFLQHVTGKITRVDLRNMGDTIKKGDVLLSVIRKGKLLHIYSPVSGKITEVNEKLKTASSLINSSPYSDGWVYVIEPVNWALELRYLIVAENFRENMRNEFQRLKDFLATTIKSTSPDCAYHVVQDGGSLVDHPLAELGPDVWDDFQTKFIDASK